MIYYIDRSYSDIYFKTMNEIENRKEESITEDSTNSDTKANDEENQEV